MSSSLASAAASDPALRLALWIGGTAVCLAVLVSVQVIVLRLVLLWQSHVRANFILRWRPIMMRAIVGHIGIVPPLAPPLRMLFLELWNEYHASLRGDARQGLNRLARIAGADKAARQMLASGRGGERLLALLTLGRLADPGDRASLLQAAKERDPYVSLMAARALVRIDAAQAITDILPLVAGRSDWPQTKILAIFREAGAAAVSEPLRQFLPTVPTAALLKLLPLLSVVDMHAAASLVHTILARAEHPELIANALKLVQLPEFIGTVRELLAHGDWRVRVQAATALGRIGSWSDMERMVPLLSDPEWWVRYRAAQAIMRLPGINQRCSTCRTG